MMDSPRCTHCGAPLEGRAFRNVCPACLWSSLVQMDADASNDEPLKDAGAGQGSWPFTLPGFEILEEIARGGMGIVYRAREQEPLREVALKMLLPFQAFSEEMRSRFRQEIRAAAALDHPNILPVYRTGENDGLPFFTMKLATGGTLADRLEFYRGRFREIAELIVAVAEAVHAAHESGILHRDLKPGNILFDDLDHPYVADFGLAKLIEGEVAQTPDITRSAALLGTPHYLSPEVAQHGVKEASIQGDVYALGAILYQLLTGRPAFVGSELTQLLSAIVKVEAERPTKVDPAIPHDLETICLKCLEKEPARRYQTARAVAEDLTRFLERRPILARPVTRAERAWLWCRRNPMMSALTGAIALLCLVVFIGVKRLQHEQSRAEQNAAAMAMFQQKLAEDPDQPAQWIDYGLLLEWSGDYSGAVTAFTKAIQLASQVSVNWRFDQARQPPRWKNPAQIENISIEVGTMRFDVVGPDPNIELVTPPLDGHSNHWLHFQMRNSTAGDHAATYWATESDPEFDESRKCIIPVKSRDAAFRTYSFELGQHPAWPGNRIVRLRFDPINGPMGRMEIDWIAICPRSEPPTTFSGPEVGFADPLLRRRALLRRGKVFEAMGQPDRAATDYTEANGIPTRDPEAGPELIDLSRFYELNLTESLDLVRGMPGKELEGLPIGIGKLGGVRFDVRGVVQLACREMPLPYPTAVTDIPIRQKFRRLHALLGAGWDVEHGQEFGRFDLHYASRETRSLPIRYGVHAKDWICRPNDSMDSLTEADVAWSGENEFARKIGARIRLYRATWVNPHPDDEVRSLDFLSTMTRCSPFLVALTIEP